MTTFLLTWNPKNLSWPFWDGTGEEPDDGFTGNWSTGGTKHGLEAGDRFFLLRQGVEPRGIMGSGVLTSQGFQAQHWDPNRPNNLANYVDIEFDTIVSIDDLLALPELSAQIEGKNWDGILASGQRLEEPFASQLEEMWRRHTSTDGGGPGASSGGKASRASGRQSDAVRRAAVENHAQAMLEERFRADGWTVKDTRYGNPYDAVATRRSDTRYLEAKGTEGDGARVEVTSGEVNHARAHPGECVIGIVSGIQVNPDGATTVDGSGVLAVHDWDPAAGTLTPSRYQWSPAR